MLAVLVLTIIGALVAAAFFAGTQEQRMAEHTRRVQRARGAAEAGLSEVLRQWPDAATNLDVYPQDSLILPWTPTPLGTGEFLGSVYRLNAGLYIVLVTGRDVADRSRQRLGLLVQPAVPCDSGIADGVEMPPPKCHIANGFQKSSGVVPLAARSWIQPY